MKIFLAILSGILLGLSQPVVLGFISDQPIDPTGFTGLLAFIGYVPLFFALRHQNLKSTFWLATLTGTVQLFLITHWLIIAMSIFGGMNIVLASASSLLLSLLFGMYSGIFLFLVKFVSKFRNFKRIPIYILYPVAICAAEYARNYIPYGGFPWGNVGYSLASINVLAQSASLYGVYGLVFVIVLVNVLIFLVFSSKAKMKYAFALVFMFVGLIAYGQVSIKNYEQIKSNLQTIKVAMLQGNIEQGIKNNKHLHASEIMRRYKNLQIKALEQEVDLSIWPETAIPYQVPSNGKRLHTLGQLSPVNILGAQVFNRKDRHILYNSALILDADDNVLDRIDKTHLVPFGEYVPSPFGSIVDKIVPNMGEFVPGGELKPVNLNNTHAGITICYEGVFPEISREFTNNGAELLINITNDAWYGVSSAPYQHLNMYVLRSIENARSYARATNSGVSAWVDPRGFVNSPTGLYEEALLIADVPINSEKTIYGYVGDVVPQLSLIFLLALLIMAVARQEHGRRSKRKFS